MTAADQTHATDSERDEPRRVDADGHAVRRTDNASGHNWWIHALSDCSVCPLIAKVGRLTAEVDRLRDENVRLRDTSVSFEVHQERGRILAEQAATIERVTALVTAWESDAAGWEMGVGKPLTAPVDIVTNALRTALGSQRTEGQG